MVLASLKNTFGFGEPTLPEGPTRLPDYFPVEPKGCEKHSQKLFSCLAIEATNKARAMERQGLHQSYFKDVKATPVDTTKNQPSSTTSETENNAEPAVAVGDNPLDECRTFVAYYQRCCDKQLKRKKNWILQEHVRVQEEYRYKGPSKDDPPLIKGRAA